MVLDAESVQVFPRSKTFLKNKFDGKYSLPKMAPNPFVGGYRRETDMKDPLDPDRASYYQTMIGIMRWMV